MDLKIEKSLAFLCLIKAVIMYVFSISRAWHTGQFLIAMAACASLMQFAHAGNPNVASEKITDFGSNANLSHITQSKAPLNSISPNSVRIDYTDICIFCHLPNMANHKIAAPTWKCTVRVLPTTLPKTNSELLR